MPHLEKDVGTYKNRGLVLIGVIEMSPLDTVIKFQKEMGTTYPMALDPEANILGCLLIKILV